MRYFIMSWVSNIKGDDERVWYSVEPSEGGGIEFTSDDLEEAKNYIRKNKGILELII